MEAPLTGLYNEKFIRKPGINTGPDIRRCYLATKISEEPSNSKYSVSPVTPW